MTKNATPNNAAQETCKTKTQNSVRKVRLGEWFENTPTALRFYFRDSAIRLSYDARFESFGLKGPHLFIRSTRTAHLWINIGITDFKTKLAQMVNTKNATQHITRNWQEAGRWDASARDQDCGSWRHAEIQKKSQHSLSSTGWPAQANPSVDAELQLTLQVKDMKKTTRGGTYAARQAAHFTVLI